MSLGGHGRDNCSRDYCSKDYGCSSSKDFARVGNDARDNGSRDNGSRDPGSRDTRSRDYGSKADEKPDDMTNMLRHIESLESKLAAKDRLLHDTQHRVESSAPARARGCKTHWTRSLRSG